MQCPRTCQGYLELRWCSGKKDVSESSSCLPLLVRKEICKRSRLALFPGTPKEEVPPNPQHGAYSQGQARKALSFRWAIAHSGFAAQLTGCIQDGAIALVSWVDNRQPKHSFLGFCAV
ncbi:MAG: hypothetical protein F6K09_03485 [Merismopedia sp. SIO2A8]|nr:hypothetical protein [Merismopedia sp. SIO2A8]